MSTPADIAMEFQASRNDRHLINQAKRLNEDDQLLLVALLWRRGFHKMGDVLLSRLKRVPSDFSFLSPGRGRQIAVLLGWVSPTPTGPAVGPGTQGAGAVVHETQPVAGSLS